MKKKTKEKIIIKMKKSCKGYTEELFSFDEIGHLNKNESIFNYKNVFEYEKKWKQFQLKFLNKKTDNIKHIKYLENSFYLTGEWIKYLEIDDIEKNEIVYSNLYSLEEYLLQEGNDYFDKLLDKLYPHEYWRAYKVPFFEPIENKKYSKMSDSELRAGGFEKELKIIQEEWNTNGYYDLSKKIKKIIKPYKNYTFREPLYYNKREKFYESNDIIGSEKLSKQIRFTHFLEDMTTYKQPWGIVKNLKKDVKKIIKKYLKEQI